jgi:hypothetical protein
VAHPALTFPAATAASAADPAAVWALLVDGSSWNDWAAEVEWAVFEGPPVLGTYVTVKQRRKRRQTAYRIARAEGPHRLVLELTFGPLAWLRLTWSLAERDDGTSLELAVTAGGPLAGMLAGGMARAAAATGAGNLTRLAALATKKGATGIGRADE